MGSLSLSRNRVCLAMTGPMLPAGDRLHIMRSRVTALFMLVVSCTLGVAQDFGTEWRFQPNQLVLDSIPVELNQRLLDEILPYAPTRFTFVDENFVRISLRDGAEIEGVLYAWKVSNYKHPESLFEWYDFEFVDTNRTIRSYLFVDNGTQLMLYVVNGARELNGGVPVVALFSISMDDADPDAFRRTPVDVERLIDEGTVITK